MENYQMLAKCLYGFEDILAKELRNMGAGKVKTGVRSVFFEGDKGFMYKANLGLRTAIKILKPVGDFRLFGPNDLYNRAYAMDWEGIMDKDQTFMIDTLLFSDKFDNSMFVSQKVKDAIADKFRDTFGTRPSVDTADPDIRIVVHIQKDRCVISLDSSGASLHHRGYKMATNIAPINEVLAAGLLLMSGWDGRSDFLDPMCGSGTFLVEAAMIACNIPPNINRDSFLFQNWKDYDQDLHQKIVEASLNKAREFHHRIIGYDKAPSAVEKARENIKNAGLSEFIDVEQQNFFFSQKPVDGHLHMVFNPPYGERLSVDLEKFYGKIGDTLKQRYPGSQAWFICSNLQALKYVGLKPSKKIKVYNGKLESRFLQYQVYEGSRKHKQKDPA